MASKKMMGYELKVGLTAALGLLFLVIMIFTVKKIQFGEAGYPIFVNFDFVDAIKPQADVVIGGGVKVGQVAEITVVGEKIRLKVILKHEVRIPKNAKFQILSKGLMGDKYLNIIAQEGAGEYLQPGAEVEGLEPTNIDKAFQRLGQVADSVKMLVGSPGVQSSFGETLRNFGALSGRLDNLVKKNEKSMNQGLYDFSEATKNLDEFSAGLEASTPHLQQMLSQDNAKNLAATLKNLESVSSRLDSQMQRIEKGEGTLGVLANDKKLGDDLRDLIHDLKKNPWKLFWKQ
jgi:phospholipid/cholesterol/gamma-HCH transport system substrate-binding protein